VQQFEQENYLRWDSLGEFLALAVSFEHLAGAFDKPKARVLGEALDAATGKFLDENKSPTRRVGGIDNRGSHFYLGLYWAQELATQEQDADLKSTFTPIAEAFASSEEQIVQELLAVQGSPVELGGYYQPDDAIVSKAMRPSSTLNRILDQL